MGARVIDLKCQSRQANVLAQGVMMARLPRLYLPGCAQQSIQRWQQP